MKKTTPKDKLIVISQISLTPDQVHTLQEKTPEMFIKERSVRGGKKAKYIEVGYVINQLNKIFGAPNWDFEILEQGQTARKNDKASEGEVWVRGKLTIIDHKNDYRVSKTQYGQHNIHTNVPIGDAFKAATSDCLKKAASLFGIGLDVYWGQLDNLDAPTGRTEAKKTVTPEERYKVAENMILSCKNPAQIIVIDERVQASKYFSKEQKSTLHALASKKVDENS